MRTFALLCAALFIMLPPAGARPYYIFAKVADSGDGTISNGELPGVPAINAGGTVVFRAVVPGTGATLFSGSTAGGGTVTRLAAVGTQFKEFGTPAINAAGTVAFLGSQNSPFNSGIYTVPSTGGAITTIADRTSNFVASGDPAIDDAGTIAFTGQEPDGHGGARLIGLYVSTSGAPRTLLINTDAPEPFSSVSLAALKGGRLLYVAQLRASGMVGTYLSTGGGAEGSRVAGLGYGSINASGKIALEVPLAVGKVNLLTIVPGKAPVTLVQSQLFGGVPGVPAINASGDVIFSALRTKPGVFLGYGVYRGGRVDGDRLFGTGKPLFGSKIVSVGVSKDSLNGSGQIAFTYSLANGHLGVAVATPTEPPPPPVPMVVATKGATVTANDAGATYASFGTPQPGDFAGKVKVGAVISDAIFGDNGRLLLRAGTTGTAIMGTTPSKLGPPSGDSALVTLKANAASGVSAMNNVILVAGLGSDAPVAAARTGTPTTGLPANVTLKSIGALDARGTTAFFLATLQGLNITAANNAALCAAPGDGSVRVLVQKGDLVNGKAVSILGTLAAAKGTLAEGRWRADDTHFGVRLSFAAAVHSQAVCVIPATAASPADWTIPFETGVVSNLPALNGTKITSFGLPGFGPGTCATLANLEVAPGGPSAVNKVALLTRRGTNPPVLLARTGSPIPADADGAPLGGVTIKTLSDPIVGPDGSVAFLLTASDPHVGTCIAHSADGATWSLLANTNGQAPFAGAWAGFPSLVLPAGANGRPIFLGTLKVDKLEGITAANSLGLWGVDTTGVLRLLMNSGQNVPVGLATKTIKTFTALLPTTGTYGAASGHDAAGQVSALATFTDGTQSLLRISIP